MILSGWFLSGRAQVFMIKAPMPLAASSQVWASKPLGGRWHHHEAALSLPLLSPLFPLCSRGGEGGEDGRWWEGSTDSDWLPNNRLDVCSLFYSKCEDGSYHRTVEPHGWQHNHLKGFKMTQKKRHLALSVSLTRLGQSSEKESEGFLKGIVHNFFIFCQDSYFG